MLLPLGLVFYSLLLQFPYDPTYGEKESLPATDILIQQVNSNLITYFSVLAGQKEPKTHPTAFFHHFQALRNGGLETLAEDPKFVAVTKKEMAEAMNISVSDMEGAAQGLLNENGGKTMKRKRRPIPVPPSAKPAESNEATTAVQAAMISLLISELS